MNQVQMQRISELYHKSKEAPLSAEELEEQRVLREAYRASVRANLRQSLDQTTVTGQPESAR